MRRYYGGNVTRISVSGPKFDQFDSDSRTRRTNAGPSKRMDSIRTRSTKAANIRAIAKANGLPSEWTKKNVLKLENSWVQHSTCLHVWTVVMDSVSTWLHKTAAEDGECNNKPFTSPKENEEMKLQQSNTSGIQTDWSWETPDLSKDGDWYKERLQPLKAAVADLPKIPNLYEEGLEILKIHRKNYGVDGASELQLIWWEFP
jgi:hypothetical protein